MPSPSVSWNRPIRRRDWREDELIPSEHAGNDIANVEARLGADVKTYQCE